MGETTHSENPRNGACRLVVGPASSTRSSLMKWLISMLVVLAGAGAPLQSGLNAELRDRLAGPIEVGFFSSIITTIALAVGFGIMVAIGKTDPDLAAIRAVPWYLWLGGFVGAFFIVVTLVGASTLDAALLVGLLVAGQMVASLAFDHFGLLSYDVNPVNLWRVLGVGLICLGVYVIQRN